MMKDKEFIKSIKAFNSKHNITYYKNKFELYEGHIQDLIFDASLYEFKEESKMNEIDKVYAINKKDLPLHIHDEWLFNSSKEIFEQRLKEG